MNRSQKKSSIKKMLLFAIFGMIIMYLIYTGYKSRRNTSKNLHLEEKIIPSNTKSIVFSDKNKGDFELYKVVFPPNAFQGKATFGITPWAMANGYPSGLRYAGGQIKLSLEEWVRPPVYQYETLTFEKPFYILLKYLSDNTKYFNKHLNEWDISFFRQIRLDDEWIRLDTDLDMNKKIARTKTDSLGTYVLLAPLVCGEDTYEPFNDSQNNHIPYILDRSKDYLNDPHFGKKIPSAFDVPEDVDWFAFDAVSGETYGIETESLSEKTKTVLGVYNVKLEKIVESVQANTLNRLDWKPREIDLNYQPSGLFYVQVKPSSSSQTGCKSQYYFSIQKATSM